MVPVAPLIACRGGTLVPHLTTANCKLTIANRHQPPPDNQARWAKNGQKCNFFKVVPTSGAIFGPFWDSGPVLIRVQLVWPILAHFLSGLWTVMESNMGPEPVKNDFFQKWPHTNEPFCAILGPF